MKTFVSDISGKRFPEEQMVPASAIRASVLELIRLDHPDFDQTKFLAINELNQYREKYMSEYLSKEIGELSELDHKVLDSLKDHSIITDDTDDDDNTKYTYGERIADRVAKFGGSWRFILIFSGFIVFWIILNAIILIARPFDPFPFILLNLFLSCLAALQAPIIMMSQNRQEAKDRLRAKEDYMVNLKSEIEVRALHEKIDHMMMYQQQELIEIQKIQIDMLTDIIKQIDKREKNLKEEIKKEDAAIKEIKR